MGRWRFFEFLRKLLGGRPSDEFALSEAQMQFLRREAEKILAKRPKGAELERLRLRKRVAEITVPDHWHGYTFFESAFFVRDAAAGIATDIQGGGPAHQDADCPLCHRPLQLIWTVSLDERFPEFVRESFSGLDKLSLYSCARCPKPTIYRLLSSDRIATIRPDVPADYDPLNDRDEQSPFEDVPDAFQRKGICLLPVPAAVERLKHKIEKDRFGSLSPSERALLSQIFAQEVDSEYELFASQLGGLPWFLQTHRDIVCPNKECASYGMVPQDGARDAISDEGIGCGLQRRWSRHGNELLADRLSCVLALPDHSCRVSV